MVILKSIRNLDSSIGADTYDHFDRYVAAIKIGTVIECFDIASNPKGTRLIHNIDEYRAFMKKRKMDICKDFLTCQIR